MSIDRHIEEHAALGVPLNPNQFVQSRVENTLAIIGDSFVVRDHPLPESGVGSVATSVTAPFTVVNCLLGQRFKTVNLGLGSTAGVNGNTFAQMLARFDSEILTKDSRYVWIHGTVNSTANDVPAVTQIADITAMLDRCRRTNRIAIITTIPPETRFNTTSRRQIVDDVNAFICGLENLRKDVIVVRYDGAYLDNALLTFQPRAGTTDGTHMNASGCILMAQSAFKKLDPLIPKVEIPWANGWEAGLTSARSIDPNPINIGTGGTITAGITGQLMNTFQIGMVGTGSAVASKVARADEQAGTWQRIVHTQNAAFSDAADGFQISSIAYASLKGLAPGDWFESYCEMRIVNPTYIKAPRFMILFTPATSERAICFENGPGTGFMNYPNGELYMVVKTPRRQVPAGSTGLKIYMEGYASTASQSFTIDFGRHVILPSP